MAHFVSLERYIPLPEDSIEYVYSTNGAAQIGLWGKYDGNTVCTVRVVSGPGTAKAGEKRGTNVQVWSFAGLNPGSRIQAFSGDRPFTTELEVRNAPAAASLGAQNKILLNGEDKAERAFIDGGFVKQVPLAKGIGDYSYAPKMGVVRGLAVHITAGAGKADGFANTFEAANASTHFVIDRDGDIAQYVAASIKAQAQGPGNGHFLSVEMVGAGNNTGACQQMTGSQLATARKLWAWIQGQYPGIPDRLAWVYSGNTKPLVPALNALYRDIAKKFVDLGYSNGDSDTIRTCIDSWGLSCHYWLDTFPKACPGIGIMGQLPQILGRDRVRLAGDEKYILS